VAALLRYLEGFLLKSILLVPFHERGYEKLAKYLEKISLPVHLPLPVELCREPILRKWASSGLWGYIRVWSPLMKFLSHYRGHTCYLTLRHFEETIDTSIKLLGLVVKAKVFSKIDLSEWLTLISERVKSSAPTNWSGVLVIDRFVEYVLLVKRDVMVDYVLQLEEFIPTPLDLLVLVRSSVVNWNCDVKSIIEWVIKYLGEYVLFSRDLTEAYDMLKKSREYRDLVTNCTSDELILTSLSSSLSYHLNTPSKLFF